MPEKVLADMSDSEVRALVAALLEMRPNDELVLRYRDGESDITIRGPVRDVLQRLSVMVIDKKIPTTPDTPRQLPLPLSITAAPQHKRPSALDRKPSDKISVSSQQASGE
ncbi:MAG: hypothetical protein D6712_14085 [Chloroflexi bacterium]|nr:MAG: hypothetical protein D6712_14085 [Chloroflexota bacterium]